MRAPTNTKVTPARAIKACWAGQTLLRGWCFEKLENGIDKGLWWQIARPVLAGLVTVYFGLCDIYLPFEGWCKKFLRWSRTVYRTRGAADCIAQLKGFALAVRKRALGDKWDWKCKLGMPSLPPTLRRDRVKKAWFQVSRFARALPAPGQKECDAAMDEHRRILTTAHRTNPVLLGELRAFCRGLGSEGLKLQGPLGSSLRYSPPSLSASVESSKKRGGQAAAVKAVTDSFRERVIDVCSAQLIVASVPQEFFGEFLLYDESRVNWNTDLRKQRCDEVFFLMKPADDIVSVEAWEVVRERLMSILACWLEVKWTDYPQAKRVCLRERGWKTRVVTPQEACFGYLCSVGGSYLKQVLKGMPSVRGSLEGNPADNINWDTGRRLRVNRSLDLKSASDYLPHDVCAAAVVGALEGYGAPDFVKRLALRSLGPYSFNEDGGAWTSCRGALMGSPFTWPLLNMVLMFCHMKSGTDGFVALNGDDYLGSHDMSSNYKFTRYVLACGLALSPTKDFCTLTGYGVFSEELISIGRHAVLPTISVRPLCALPKDPTHPLWADGPSVSDAVDRLSPSWREPAAKLIEITYRAEFAKLRALGIEPTNPRWVCGGGFPGQALQSGARLGRMLVSQDTEQVVEWQLRIGRAWTKGVPSQLGTVVHDKVKVLLAEFPSTRSKKDGGHVVREYQDSMTATLSYAYLLCFGTTQDERALSLSKTAKSLKEVKSQICQRGYWVPLDKVRSMEGLEQKLANHEPRFSLNPRTVTGADLSY